MSLRADFSASAVAAGLLACFVGFGSTFAVIIRGLTAVGATPEQAASGLLAVTVAMGVASLAISAWTKLPISIAWSTPGAALLAGSSVAPGGFAGAVGAFMICAVLLVLAGQFKPLGRAVAAIPKPIASAMLAGVLLPLCLAPVRAVAGTPVLGLAIVVTWAIVARINRLMAVLVAAGLIGFTADLSALHAAALWPVVVFTPPVFSVSATIGLAIPLFIVTVASQNIPGTAILNLNGYHPNASRLFTATGIFSLLATPFGSIAANLAVIVTGIGYMVIGLLAGAATAFIAAAPPLLIEAVAGLALLGSFAGGLTGCPIGGTEGCRQSSRRRHHDDPLPHPPLSCRAIAARPARAPRRDLQRAGNYVRPSSARARRLGAGEGRNGLHDDLAPDRDDPRRLPGRASL